ncbi:hypothetical protein [Parvibium lacunae]|uniref:Uncharacterized protein n=1 Tax=Parvibium lacunae TaxID=1888893 RepID=A0A368KYC5_9BURK|nr:hypothetical protein [Parvibium lacunae]RCS56456.1 hypothetical protein DU000_12045 [Parvibium lacunae]
MNLQLELKSSLINFLTSGDESSLIAMIDEHPEIVTSVYGDYPDFHRVVDVVIGGKYYRVCRQISNDERLTLSVIDEPSDVSGVPIWLEGEKLRKWAEAEEEDPSDEPVDWEKYR